MNQSEFWTVLARIASLRTELERHKGKMSDNSREQHQQPRIENALLSMDDRSEQMIDSFSFCSKCQLFTRLRYGDLRQQRKTDGNSKAHCCCWMCSLQSALCRKHEYLPDACRWRISVVTFERRIALIVQYFGKSLRYRNESKSQ